MTHLDHRLQRLHMRKQLYIVYRCLDCTYLQHMPIHYFSLCMATRVPCQLQKFQCDLGTFTSTSHYLIQIIHAHFFLLIQVYAILLSLVGYEPVHMKTRPTLVEETDKGTLSLRTALLEEEISTDVKPKRISKREHSKEIETLQAEHSF